MSIDNCDIFQLFMISTSLQDAINVYTKINECLREVDVNLEDAHRYKEYISEYAKHCGHLSV